MRLLLLCILLLPVPSLAGDPCYPDQSPHDDPAQCNDIAKMKWDEATSIEEIAPNSEGVIAVIDGKPNFDYKVEGSGFFLDVGRTIDHLEEKPERSTSLYTTQEACGTGEVTVTDFCGTPVSKIIPTTIALKWDESTLVVEIAANATITLQIVNGSPPFTYKVTGSGFYFDAAGTITEIEDTTARTITLNTINACGTGTITVTDSCGDSLTTQIRSDEGTWVTEIANAQAECPFKAPASEWHYLSPRLLCKRGRGN